MTPASPLDSVFAAVLARRAGRDGGPVEITRRELNPGIVTLEIRGPLQMGVECKRLEIAVDELLQENNPIK